MPCNPGGGSRLVDAAACDNQPLSGPSINRRVCPMIYRPFMGASEMSVRRRRRQWPKKMISSAFKSGQEPIVNRNSEIESRKDIQIESSSLFSVAA